VNLVAFRAKTALGSPCPSTNQTGALVIGWLFAEGIIDFFATICYIYIPILREELIDVRRR
jgi:hypothetical protein